MSTRTRGYSLPSSHLTISFDVIVVRVKNLWPVDVSIKTASLSSGGIPAFIGNRLFKTLADSLWESMCRQASLGIEAADDKVKRRRVNTILSTNRRPNRAICP